MADCIEAIKSSLSAGCSLVALACKRRNKQYLDLREYANQRYTSHLCANCGHKLDVAPQVQGNSLATFGF